TGFRRSSRAQAPANRCLCETLHFSPHCAGRNLIEDYQCCEVALIGISVRRREIDFWQDSRFCFERVLLSGPEQRTRPPPYTVRCRSGRLRDRAADTQIVVIERTVFLKVGQRAYTRACQTTSGTAPVATSKSAPSVWIWDW